MVLRHGHGAGSRDGGAVAAGKGDEAASMVGNAAAVSRIAATSASAPPSSVNVTLICRPTPDPRACKTALTLAEARSAGDPFAASVQFAMARATAARSLARNLSASAPASPPSGMHDCAELLDISLAQLRDARGRRGRGHDVAQRRADESGHVRRRGRHLPGDLHRRGSRAPPAAA